MDERGNPTTLASGHATIPPDYWAGIVFYFLSIFFNVTFIYVTSKEDVRNKSVDHTLSFLCCVQICSAINMIIKTTLLFDERTTVIHSSVFPLFDTLEFLFKGIYIALLLILNTNRFIVMKNVGNIQNNNTRVQSSKCVQVVVSLVVLLLSSVYCTVSILEMPVSSYNIAIYILHGIVIGIPWAIFLVLHSVMVINTVVVMYKRKRRNVVSMATEGRSNMVVNTRGPALADKLIQQVATSLVFQTWFIVIPFTYTTAMDLVHVYSNIGTRFDTFTCIVKSVLPFLNPIGLGLFLKQRRDNLVSFLGVRSMTNSRRTAVVENDYLRSNQDKHASCKRNLQDISLPKSVRCDLNQDEMLLSGQLSQPRLFVVSNNGGASLGHKIYPDTWSNPHNTYIESDIDVESMSGISDISSKYFSSCSNFSTLAVTHFPRQQPNSEEIPLHSTIPLSAEQISSVYSEESATTTSLNEENAWKYFSPIYGHLRTKHTPNHKCRSDSIWSMLSVVSTIHDAISLF